MGKRGRGNKGGRGGRGGGRGGGGGRAGGGRYNPTNYPEVERKNETFEKYYNELGILSEEEKPEFWAALRRELPNSFRFTGSKGHALAVQQRLIDHYIPEITSIEFDGQPVEPPKPLEWYPNKLAWAMTTPKQVVRKFKPFASFQKFLVSETSVGNISRQEVVSMVPPLLIDIKPGMTVLDLCAAPGSKTAQLIEMVHGGEEARVRKVLRKVAQEQGREVSPDGFEIEAEKSDADAEDDYSDDGRSTGLVVANDVDYRRAQMLVHQVKRLNSPNMIVTNHDATQFPSIEIPSQKGAPRKYLKFDRILADVPCSGDGTARKNPNVWKDWIPGNGVGLYIMQVRILVRALQMLKVGGRVVYSTCSMNPVENEAVIATAIDRCGGNANVRLVDCSNELPGLKRRPGLNTWKIMDKAGRMWSSWEDVEKAKETEGVEGFSRLTEGMFPPTAASEDERIPLERCMRVYPHLQDTGGFFITVLEKQKEIKARPESEPKKVNPTPVSNLLTEIEQKGATGDPSIKLETLEELVPSSGAELEQTRAPAAARSNQPKDEPETLKASPLKREFDETDESEDVSAKRVKTEDIEAADAEAAEPVKTEDEVAQPVKKEAYPGADEVPAPKEHYPPPPAAEADRVAASEAPKPLEKRKNTSQHEEAFKYLSPGHPELESIYRFYELAERFPRDRFMVRNATGEPVKAIYYTSALAKDILTTNEGRGMKFVHCGVKMFMKQDAQGQDICRWRIQTEGIPIIEPWVGEGRVVRLYRRDTLRKLLIEMFPRVSNEGWQSLGEIGPRVKDLPMGCCVLRVETSEAEDGFRERLVLPLWRSLHSLNLMLPKEERKAMLLRLYNDDTPLVDHSQEHRAAAKATAAAAAQQETQLQAAIAADAAAEPETLRDSTDGTAALNADMDVEESHDPTGPIGSVHVGTENEALRAEDEIRADQQVRVEVGREGEEGEGVQNAFGEGDQMNTTV